MAIPKWPQGLFGVPGAPVEVCVMCVFFIEPSKLSKLLGCFTGPIKAVFIKVPGCDNVLEDLNNFLFFKNLTGDCQITLLAFEPTNLMS